MAAPEWVPDDQKDLYEFFRLQGDQSAIKELEDLYKPAEVIQQERAERPDPFAPSFYDTPQERAELKRTERERMNIPLDPAVVQQQQELAQRLAQEQAVQEYENQLLAEPETFYERVLAGSVPDPSMTAAIAKQDRNIMSTLDKQKQKTFRALTEQNIQAGQDLFTAQQNARASLIAIERAERVSQGFLTPPVKAGEEFKVTEADDFVNPFGRKTIVTPIQAEENKKRQQEADLIRSQMFQGFAAEAAAELRASGEDFEPSEVGDLAEQKEKEFAGSLFGNFYQLARQAYLSEKQMTIDEFNALSPNSPEKKEVRDLATYFHDDFVNNVYPEYSGDEEVMAAANLSFDDSGNVIETPPTFFGELMLDERQTGEVVETRVGQSMRGMMGLIRPVTLGLSNAMTYDVYKDPETGELVYPEGEGWYLQQPQMVTPERADAGYWETLSKDIYEGRTFTDDTMSMTQLTDAIGDEYAGILGMGIEVFLPVTPVGMVPSTLKVAGGGTRLVGSGLKYVGAAKAATKLDTAGQSIYKAGQSLDNVVAGLGNKMLDGEQQKVLRRLNFENSDVDLASGRLAQEINELTKAGDVVGAEKELLDSLKEQQKVLKELQKQGVRTIPFDQMEANVPTEVLLRLVAEKPQEVKAVVNDIVQSRRLVEVVAREGLDAVDPTSSFATRLVRGILNTPYTGEARIMAIVDALGDSGGVVDDTVKYLVKDFLSDPDNLFAIQRAVTRTYVDDFVFNLTPENFIFISPRTAVSTRAYKAHSTSVNEAVKAFFSEEGKSAAKVVGDEIELSLNLGDRMSRARNLVSKTFAINAPEVAKSLLSKLDETTNGVVKLTQQEFDILHGLIKEQEYVQRISRSNVSAQRVAQPRRATPEAVAKADIPLERRMPLIDAFKARAKRLSESLLGKSKTQPKISYEQASQYGLVRLMQRTEQEFSNLPQTLAKYAKEQLDAAGGDTVLAYNNMIQEAAITMKIEGDFAILHTLMNKTFDMTGISPDVLDAFIRQNMVEGAGIVENFNTMYDTFVRLYPSKEVATLGGKVFERKFTVIPMTNFIAEGMKQKITNRITMEMETLFPELFYKHYRTPEELLKTQAANLTAKTQAEQKMLREVTDIKERIDHELEIARKQKAALRVKDPEMITEEVIEDVRLGATTQRIVLSEAEEAAATAEILEVVNAKELQKNYKANQAAAKAEARTIHDDMVTLAAQQSEEIRAGRSERIRTATQKLTDEINNVAAREDLVRVATEGFDEVLPTLPRAAQEQITNMVGSIDREIISVRENLKYKTVTEAKAAAKSEQEALIQAQKDLATQAKARYQSSVKGDLDKKALKKVIQDTQAEIKRLEDAMPQVLADAEQEFLGATGRMKQLEARKAEITREITAQQRFKTEKTKGERADAARLTQEANKAEVARLKAERKAVAERVQQEINDELSAIAADVAKSREIRDAAIAQADEVAATTKAAVEAIIDGEIVKAQKYIDMLLESRKVQIGFTTDPAKMRYLDDLADMQNRFVMEVYPEAQKEIFRRSAAELIYKTIGREIQESIASTQKNYIDALLSDLYEGKAVSYQVGVKDVKMTEIKGYGYVPSKDVGQMLLDEEFKIEQVGGVDFEITQHYGRYVLEVQNGNQIAASIRAILTRGNLNKVKQALMVDGKFPAELSKFTEGIQIPEESIRALGLTDPTDYVASQLIIYTVKENTLQSMEKVMGVKASGLISALENIGFPPTGASFTFESLRPVLKEWNGRGIIALPKDVEVINGLKQKSIEGALGQTLDVLGRKSQSVLEYGVSSLGYAIIAANQGTKGGMLGGTFAPTGKYITVNSITAPLIQMYTTPSFMGKSLRNYLIGGGLGFTAGAMAGAPIAGLATGLMISGPLQKLLLATGKTAEQAGRLPTSILTGIAGASIGAFGGGADAAIIGFLTSGTGGLILEDILRWGRGNKFIGQTLGFADPTAKVLETIDGRIFTAAELQDMMMRNNILFGQVNFEFSQRSLEGVLRSSWATATGQKASAVRQAWRWLRPDRPNFWNTMAMETDNAFRMQAFTDSLVLGHTEQQAAEIARRSLFDYSDINPVEARTIAQFFLFYSFMRQSAMEVATSFFRNDIKGLRNIVASIRAAQEVKKSFFTEDLFNDASKKEKAVAAMWTQMGQSYDQTLTLHYGPAYPSVESFLLLSNTLLGLYDVSGLSEYGVEGGVANTLLENTVVKGNPYARAIFETQAKKFRSENAPHGRVPVREVIAFQSSGLFDTFALAFDLEIIPPSEMKLGDPTYPVAGRDQNVQYRFASKSGSMKYLLWKFGLLAMGVDRGVTDWAASTSEKLELEGARLKRYTDGNMYLEAAGLSTPIMVPNHVQQHEKVIQQIIKELSAEMD